jgi:hypothetical protein
VYRLAMTILPLAIAAATLVAIIKLSDYQHRSNLPEGYVALEAAGFEVYHPPGLEGLARRVAESATAYMTAAAQGWGSRLGGLEPPSEPIRLTLFPSHADFEQFGSSALSEDLSHNGGYFDAATMEIALVLPESHPSDLADMGIRHEIAHLLIARGDGRYGTQMPVWLNEGLATWLETADPAQPDGPASVSDWVRLVAAASPPLTLQAVTAASSASFSSEGNEVYYAYANLLVHFLVDRVPDRFWGFARDARDGDATDFTAFVQRFGPLEPLEKRWQEAMATARQRYVVELSEAAERGL